MVGHLFLAVKAVAPCARTVEYIAYRLRVA
jgi:hypothetical protein